MFFLTDSYLFCIIPIRKKGFTFGLFSLGQKYQGHTVYRKYSWLWAMQYFFLLGGLSPASATWLQQSFICLDYSLQFRFSSLRRCFFPDKLLVWIVALLALYFSWSSRNRTRPIQVKQSQYSILLKVIDFRLTDMKFPLHVRTQD